MDLPKRRKHKASGNQPPATTSTKWLETVNVASLPVEELQDGIRKLTAEAKRRGVKVDEDPSGGIDPVEAEKEAYYQSYRKFLRVERDFKLGKVPAPEYLQAFEDQKGYAAKLMDLLGAGKGTDEVIKLSDKAIDEWVKERGQS